MDRRRFLLSTLAGVLGGPRAAATQPGRRVPRIGWLTNSLVHTPNVEAFQAGMRAVGYADIHLVLRAAAGQNDRLPALAAELVARNVDVIVTDGGPAATAAKQATTTIPIVIGAASSEFLVRDGLVGSLARPGGNVTGFTISTGPELYGKRLELLHEALPGLSRLVVVWNPRNEGARVSLQAVEDAARTLGVHTQSIAAARMEEMERGLGSAARNAPGALLAIADAFLWSQRARIVSLASRLRLPGMYPEREFAVDGGLMAYGISVSDNFRRVASYVDRIFKGTRPADLPIQQPATFELTINMRTAKTLGLTIPAALLLRADRLIE
jgi:putative ABC transport system substrate-binding protein